VTRAVATAVAIMCSMLLLVGGTVWMITPSPDDGQRPITSSGKPAQPSDLDSDQQANARTIIGVGKTARAGRTGTIVALMVAMQESQLRNLDHGDRDSLGLFQQRPSQGWGSTTQVQDPEYSARAFYGIEPRSDNDGLLQIPDWESMTKNDAGQAVQRSAYPQAYAKWESLATKLYADYRSAPARG